MSLPEVDIIGTGNLAFNLAPALEQCGMVINNVFGRSIESAKSIADNLYQANPTTELNFSASKSTLFILAVSDDAIEEVSQELILPDYAIAAHTSGSMDLSVLGYTASPNIGVLYPLQTFSKQKRVDFSDVPLLVEGDNKFTKNVLLSVARKLTQNVLEARSAQRRMIHLAAIFAANFTNSLLVQANELLEKADADLEILAPLLEETIRKSLTIGPKKAQTGPAARGDLEVLDQHMELLERFPEIQEVYRLINQQILDRHERD
ncbi:MAG: Rossmann-like and DUF2520 domain-containing protein [Bacteroidota bacterium]